MRDSMKVFKPVVQDLEDDFVFKKCLGREEHFRNFEVFFMKKIKEKGYEWVMQKYLLDRGEIADEMVSHIYMGMPPAMSHA